MKGYIHLSNKFLVFSIHEALFPFWKKTLLYILLFHIGVISYAQDQQLFENEWYLYEVLRHDMGTLYKVSEIEPSITPSLSISEDLTFSGVGACNTFNGTYQVIFGIELSTLDFEATTDDCGVVQHNNFESEYFGFISGGYTYTIDEESGGRVLVFESPLMGYALFKSFPLSTTAFQKGAFQLCPNPAKNEMFLVAGNFSERRSIKIFDIDGKLLREENLLGNETVINISRLHSGLYFLSLQDGTGKGEVKKFIKQ